VVLTGGAKAFSAGFDLKDAEGRSRRTMDIGALAPAPEARAAADPGLAGDGADHDRAIEGFCIGGGVALAVALDFRVMARDAHLRVPEIGLGMNMSWQSIPRMLHLIGPARTKQAVILADQRISAAEAYEWGLVEEVADPGQPRSTPRWRLPQGRRAAAAVGRHDQADRQSAGARARRPRQPHGRRPVRAGEPDRGSQGRRRGVPGKRKPRFRDDETAGHKVYYGIRSGYTSTYVKLFARTSDSHKVYYGI
jgi:enoyl-CoA hydratase/carnithine racemase